MAGLRAINIGVGPMQLGSSHNCTNLGGGLPQVANVLSDTLALDADVDDLNDTAAPAVAALGIVDTALTALADALAAVVTDTATLVSDGETPTQGHVNTLNGHMTTLAAAVTDITTKIGTLDTDMTAFNDAATAVIADRAALDPDIASLKRVIGDVIVLIDSAKITSRCQLRSALAAAQFAALSGFGGLTD